MRRRECGLATAVFMKPEATSPPTAPTSLKRPAAASAGPGKRLAGDPLETKLSATRKGSFLPSVDPEVPPHTLLLGTQPSDNALAHGGYYMTNANAFWHIVGDALGFRRGFHIGGRSDAPDFVRRHLIEPYPNPNPNPSPNPSPSPSPSPDQVRRHLMHSEEVSYDEAMRRLTARGYALWDVVADSERKGSLDGDIKNPTFADVQALVELSFGQP